MKTKFIISFPYILVTESDHGESIAWLLQKHAELNNLLGFSKFSLADFYHDRVAFIDFDVRILG